MKVKRNANKILVLTILVMTTLACGQMSFGVITPTPKSNLDVSDPADFSAVQDISPTVEISTPTPAPTIEIVETEDSYMDRITPLPPSGHFEWSVYNNPTHKFAFQFPSWWQVTGEAAHIQSGQRYAESITLTSGIYRLVIWVKSTAEDTKDVIFSLPTDSKDFGAQGSVLFLGKQIPKTLVWENGVEVAYLYGGGEWIEAGDLAFAIFLVNQDEGEMESVYFYPEVVKDVEKIIASFVAAGVDYTPPGPAFIEDDLPCESADENSAAYLACNLRDAIRSDNLSAIENLMADPFPFGGWGSEWQSITPREIFEQPRMYMLPQDRSKLAFTINRDQFPELYGIRPDDMLGPDVNTVMVIYTEGWGQDGYGSALLFIAEPAPGEYQWHGLVFSAAHFDK